MRLLFAALAALIFSASASAQDRYPQIIVAMPGEVDPELADFVENLRRVTSRASLSSGPAPEIEALLADTVELLVGNVEFVEYDRFETFLTTGRDDALSALGRLASYDSPGPEAQQRRGMDLLVELAYDPAIGENPWMPGEICTSAFGRLSFDEMRALLARTDSSIHDWRIASALPTSAMFHRGHPGMDWKAGQLLLTDPGAPSIRSCCWEAVVGPRAGEDAYVQAGFGRGALRPYLNNHLCFGWQNGAWKVTRIAIRTP